MRQVEARASGHDGVVAVARATGIARSTIGRGLADLRAGAVMFSPRDRRRGGGGKPATETQPGLLAALKKLVRPSIRGDPEALGAARFPAATRLLITGDCGGSNGVRVRLWKCELQVLAVELGIGEGISGAAH